MSRLINFSSGTGTDSSGRKIEEVLAFTQDELERNHDFIQWLFPNHERSAVNPSAPVLDESTCDFLRTDKEARGRLREAFDMMMSFYGFRVIRDSQVIKIVLSDSFSERSEIWLTPHNHNFLRLTRILKCLMAVGGRPLALALAETLDEIAATSSAVVSPRTRGFWRAAVNVKE